MGGVWSWTKKQWNEFETWVSGVFGGGKKKATQSAAKQKAAQSSAKQKAVQRRAGKKGGGGKKKEKTQSAAKKKAVQSAARGKAGKKAGARQKGGGGKKKTAQSAAEKKAVQRAAKGKAGEKGGAGKKGGGPGGEGDGGVYVEQELYVDEEIEKLLSQSPSMSKEGWASWRDATLAQAAKAGHQGHRNQELDQQLQEFEEFEQQPFLQPRRRSALGSKEHSYNAGIRSIDNAGGRADDEPETQGVHAVVLAASVCTMLGLGFYLCRRRYRKRSPVGATELPEW